MLEMMGIPYTGSGVLASALGMDKIASRKVFQYHGIPFPPFVVVQQPDRVGFNPERFPFSPPFVVKPSREGSSVGISIVEKSGALQEAMNEAFRYGPTILVEKYIRGKEEAVGILEERALGVIEIRPKSAFYDYTAKYTPGMSEHIYPAPLPGAIYRSLLDYGLRAHQALGCRGYSRVDLLLDEAGAPYVLEVNTLPGMTETSLLPEIAGGEGIPFDGLVERILKTAFASPSTVRGDE
jgi:D-alanine-D-alanine ligase